MGTSIGVRQAVRGVLAVVLAMGATTTFADSEYGRDGYRNTDDNTLLVWAGDKAHEARDFIAVVDFDSESRHYGQVIRVVPLPAGKLTRTP